MGAKILQRKLEVNYRKGEFGKCCGNYCNNFVNTYPLRGGNGQILNLTQRCRQIGLKRPRKYQVRRDHTCDLFDNSERVEALAAMESTAAA